MKMFFGFRTTSIMAVVLAGYSNPGKSEITNAASGKLLIRTHNIGHSVFL